MFTKKTYKYLTQHYWITSVLCILPFDWDAKTERLSCYKSKFRVFLWYFNTVSSWAPTVRIWQCFIVGLMTGTRDISFLCVDIMFALTFTAQVAWQFVLVFHREEMAALMNQLITFDKKFTRKSDFSFLPCKKSDIVSHVNFILFHVTN